MRTTGEPDACKRARPVRRGPGEKGHLVPRLRPTLRLVSARPPTGHPNSFVIGSISPTSRSPMRWTILRSIVPRSKPTIGTYSKRPKPIGSIGDRNRERFKQIAALPPKPGQEALRDKLRAWKERIGTDE
jgi:hypothetical protein